jgi:hypothetical protein
VHVTNQTQAVEPTAGDHVAITQPAIEPMSKPQVLIRCSTVRRFRGETCRSIGRKASVERDTRIDARLAAERKAELYSTPSRPLV